MPAITGMCKFRGKWLQIAEYKEWVCHDPTGNNCFAQCKYNVNSINVDNGGQFNLDSHIKSTAHKKSIAEKHDSWLCCMLVIPQTVSNIIP